MARFDVPALQQNGSDCGNSGRATDTAQLTRLTDAVEKLSYLIAIRFSNGFVALGSGGLCC
jgi:hypothetical protein